ncbi:helix-turn-helix domain-containing protein [Heyndrickxia camelliae]|uniref:XRE family transcriptional regulator n=1 Tax=Heyndrickxia camelliae TaxID=1707093 RepID=A0A2N3LEV5_9BACI|nr:helix-turn-helix transcriptional regulator [Heyndrickxia camelliae]PKR83063.1 XRE family transcriptional regulator [Heyndrickxia camelliae]
MDSRDLFKERLILLRKERKLTQTELAAIMDVTKATINKYEKGGASPSYEMLWKLADFFNVSVDYLMGKSDSFSGDPQINKEISEIKLIYDKLNDEQKELVLNILRTFTK